MPEEERLQSRIANKNKAVVFRITIAQFAITLVVTLFLYVLVGFQAAYSALIAGMISTLTTLYIGGRFFFGPDRPAGDRLAAIYMAELIKVLLVAVAFCASFILLDVHFLAFIGAYLATVAVYWMAMVWPAFRVQIKQIRS